MSGLWRVERDDRTCRGLHPLPDLWVERVLGMSQCDGAIAECKECNWAVAEPTRQAALDAPKDHRRKSGHLVVISESW